MEMRYCFNHFIHSRLDCSIRLVSQVCKIQVTIKGMETKESPGGLYGHAGYQQTQAGSLGSSRRKRRSGQTAGEDMGGDKVSTGYKAYVMDR